MITPEKLRDIFKFYRGEPQQVSGVWTLYSALQAKAPELLAEDSDWLTKYKEAPPHPNPLNCPYQSQRDNYRDASRTCFSSSCAMLLMALKPGAIHSDDEYIREVFSHGDSTDASAQLAALAHFGVKAEFRTNGDKALIQKQIDNGIPVPCGYLHHGTPLHPEGGGHWCCVIGYDDSGVFVHDPWGSCNLTDGTFTNTNGAKQHYSDANWTKTRWMVDGPGTGWCIIAEHP